MSEQRTLASVVYDTKRKVTSRERFLAEMDRVIPWAPLLALIAPHYPKDGRGRRPLPLETMRRRSKVRARCELVFHVVKRLWGFANVRYRGLAKDMVRALTTFALTNLYLVRHTLAPQGT